MFRVLVPQLLETTGDAGVAAHRVERQRGHQQATEDQQRNLHDIGQRHRLEAAIQLVEQREHADQHQRQHLVHAGDLGHRDRAQPQDRGQVDENVQAQPEHRHQRTDPVAVPLLQELRHRVDAVAQEDRQEVLAHDQQGKRSHPFVGGDGQADRVAGAGHADDLFGRNVGGNQRRADRPPRQRAPGQEIVFGTLAVPGLLTRDPLRQHEDAGQVDQYDCHIECCQSHVMLLVQRCTGPRAGKCGAQRRSAPAQRQGPCGSPGRTGDHGLGIIAGAQRDARYRQVQRV